MKKLIVALAMTSLMVMAIGISNVLAKPKPKEGNPGLPGCLAKVDQLQAELDAMQNYAPVSQTGQTICYDSLNNETDCAGTGQDGDYQTGVPWPDPRFADRGDGTVRDNLTGLIWLQNANCFGARIWINALNDCNTLAIGVCGLTDGSQAGDWRLPNVRELESLVDYGRENPSFPEIHPFAGLVAGRYWSSTSNNAPEALFVNFYFGYPGHEYKDIEFYVWPVRNPQ